MKRFALLFLISFAFYATAENTLSSTQKQTQLVDLKKVFAAAP